MRVILDLVSPSRLIQLFSQSECSLWLHDQHKQHGELPSPSSILHIQALISPHNKILHV